ncbi:unnamed protein product [Amoebophrya sp. A120]|nr:unnamed protein product [Amoebophrya sp. A120]|eukprot:GSA120T00019124001.1
MRSAPAGRSPVPARGYSGTPARKKQEGEAWADRSPYQDKAGKQPYNYVPNANSPKLSPRSQVAKLSPRSMASARKATTKTGLQSGQSSPSSFFSVPEEVPEKTPGDEEELGRFGRFRKWCGEHKKTVAAGVAVVSLASIAAVVYYKPELAPEGAMKKVQDTKEKWTYTWNWKIKVPEVKVHVPTVSN